MTKIPDRKRRGAPSLRAPSLRAPSQRAPILIESLENRTLLTFGLTTTTSAYTVNNGAQLVFSISRTAGSGSVGDLTSMLYNGTQMEAPFSYESRYSHYESGLSSATVVTATVDPNNQWILIACNDTGSTGVGVIQYYLARNGYNNIYMATYSPGPNSPSPGEMRFITYTNPTVLTNIPAPSNNNGNTGAIESSDVFGHADGTTTSKYYGEYRAIDTQTYGDTGAGVGIFMNIGSRETSSGGPFYKDIDFQSNELYNYTFSGHSQTEAFRPGLKGFYALEFTTGATPAAPDYTFIDTLGIGDYVSGYVGASGRGTLVGNASGVPSSLQDTVALSNAADQYWATPDSTTGAYTITGVLPGTYTETIYQGELAVGTQTVNITAGQTTAENITDTLYAPSAANTIFRIGTWDGTPLGFLNSNLITDMHPTDVRMSPWAADSTGVTNFTVGTDSDSTFPMAEWHAQNSAAPYVDTDNRITFTLTSAQAATALTFRIGLTRLDSARPNITVNSSWTSAIQGIATEPDSRGLTTGNWRGNNVTYSFNIPTSALHSGTNTIDIYSVSGSTGTLYSGYQIYDALDLVTTASVSTSAPVVNSIAVTPANLSVPINGQQTFTAVAKDQFGNVIPVNFTWSAANGTVDGTGLYTAPPSPSSDTVTATSGSVSGSTSVNVVADVPPTVATPAAASPSPVNATSIALSVLGADNNGEAALTYTWATVGTSPAAVAYSANATNAAKNTTATFTKAGTYDFQVTITDASGLTATSSVSVNVGFGTFTDSVDIGAPATVTAGSLLYDPNSGKYTIEGNGTDIWGTSDQFRFNFTTLSGNAVVVARVDSVTDTNSNAKSGVMLRDSTASNAAFANVWLSPGGLVKFETRASNGASATYSASASAATTNVWVRLIRSGASDNQFSAYFSLNGTTWTQVGTTQTVTMATVALAGLAVTSHTSNTALNTAVFDNVTATLIPAWLSATSVASWNPSTHVLTVTGATSIIADPGTDEPIIQASGSAAVLTIDPASPGDIHLGGLSLTSGASATVTSLGSARSLTNYDLLVIGVPGATVAPTYTIDSTSTLDLTDNDMAILYGSGTSPLSAVNAQLLAAYDGGLWNNAGLTSSIAATQSGRTELGFGEASTLGLTTFDGLTLGGNAVLVKYTVGGDANLDGTIGLADYNAVLANYNGTRDTWTSGSFDYSGSVGLTDYNTIIANYNETLASLLPSTASAALTTSLTTTTASSAATASTSTTTTTTPKTTTTTKPARRTPVAIHHGYV
jgi:rhamnogalacturonan endolyase